MYIDEEKRLATEKLFNDNVKMTSHFAKKFYSNMKFGVYEYDDLMQTANLSLWKACLTFDQSKGHKFFTYASRCIMNDLLMFKNKSFKENREDYISYNSEVQSEEDTTFLDLYFTDFDISTDKITSGVFLDDLQKKVETYYLFEGKDWYIQIIRNMLEYYSMRELIEIYDYEKRDVKNCFELLKYMINKDYSIDDVLEVKVKIYTYYPDYIVKSRKVLREHEASKEKSKVKREAFKYYTDAEVAYDKLKKEGYSVLVNKLKNKRYLEGGKS